MMMKKQNILIMTFLSILLFGVFLSFLGCEKIDVPEGTPKCIQDKIKKEKDKCLDKVYKYDYTGKKVYYFNSTCPDVLHCVYDENCNSICCPDGGINGTGDGKCLEFFQKATNQKLIWQK